MERKVGEGGRSGATQVNRPSTQVNSILLLQFWCSDGLLHNIFCLVAATETTHGVIPPPTGIFLPHAQIQYTLTQSYTHPPNVWNTQRWF